MTGRQIKLQRQLIEAITLRDVEAVRRFINAGADVNAPGLDGTRRIHVNRPIPRASWRNTYLAARTPPALNLACRESSLAVVRVLLAAGAEVDRADDVQGNTALGEACLSGRISVVRRILKARPAVNVTNKGGDTPLHMVFTHPSKSTPKLVRALCAAGANAGAVNRYGRTPLHEAFDFTGVALPDGHIEIIRQMIAAGAAVDAKDSAGDTALHLACGKRPRFAVELIQQGASPNVLNDAGHTPLAEFCRSYIGLANNERLQGYMQGLTEHGCDVNAPLGDGSTLAHWAVSTIAPLSALESLSRFQLDLDARDNAGNTALHWACADGKLTTVHWLVGAGVDTEAVNHQGEKPGDVVPVTPQEQILDQLPVSRPRLQPDAAATAGPAPS